MKIHGARLHIPLFLVIMLSSISAFAAGPKDYTFVNVSNGHRKVHFTYNAPVGQGSIIDLDLDPGKSWSIHWTVAGWQATATIVGAGSWANWNHGFPLLGTSDLCAPSFTFQIK